MPPKKNTVKDKGKKKKGGKNDGISTDNIKMTTEIKPLCILQGKMKK